MRVTLVAAASVWAAGAQAQEVRQDGAALLDALGRTHAYACTIGGASEVVVLRELPDGGLERVGAEPSGRVTREGGRIVALQGTDYLQIDGPNSVSIRDGEVAQGTCDDLSLQFHEAVVLALGSDGGTALASMRSDLLSQLSAAEDEAQRLHARLNDVEAERDRLTQEIGATAADLEVARARLAVASQLPECLDRVRGTLSIVLSFLEEGAGVEMPSSVRANYARSNAERVQEVIEACDLELPTAQVATPGSVAETSRAAEVARRPPSRLDPGMVGGPAAIDPGPPMTEGERDAFRVAVQGCWNVGNLPPEASRTSVTVAFELDRSARLAGDVELLTSSGGEGAAVDSAFEAARRAILRCQGDGFPLPLEKFEQWRVVEMSFDPENMAIR